MNKDRPFLRFDTEDSYLYHLGLALFPLIIYGFYKNGILPLLNQDISLIEMVRPLLFPIVGFGMGILADYVYWWKSSCDNIWTHNPIYGLIISMTLPISANIVAVAVLMFLGLYLGRFLSYSKYPVKGVMLTKFIFIVIFTVLAGISYTNQSEQIHTFVYSILDVFFGRSVGGICATSIFWIGLAYIYLWFDPYYKKEIPMYIIVTYVLMLFGFEILMPTGNLIKEILNSSVWFASVFLATEIKSSPYTEKGKMIYGIAIGLLGFFFTRFFNYIDGIYLSIILLSLMVSYIDKIVYGFSIKKKKFCRIGILQKEELEKKVKLKRKIKLVKKKK